MSADRCNQNECELFNRRFELSKQEKCQETRARHAPRNIESRLSGTRVYLVCPVLLVRRTKQTR
jgi:hypothetical protein